MNKTTVKIPLEKDQYLYRTKLISVDCEPGTYQAEQCRDLLLKTVADNLDFRRCGPAIFQKLKMYHSGDAWVLETEAVVEEG